MISPVFEQVASDWKKLTVEPSQYALHDCAMLTLTPTLVPAQAIEEAFTPLRCLMIIWRMCSRWYMALRAARVEWPALENEQSWLAEVPSERVPPAVVAAGAPQLSLML